MFCACIRLKSVSLNRVAMKSVIIYGRSGAPFNNKFIYIYIPFFIVIITWIAPLFFDKPARRLVVVFRIIYLLSLYVTYGVLSRVKKYITVVFFITICG